VSLSVMGGVNEDPFKMMGRFTVVNTPNIYKS